MSAHTPGPWAPSRSTPCAIVAPSGQIIADVGHPRDVPILMAAPELLACLQQLIDGMVDEEDSDDRVLERSRAILAQVAGVTS